MPCAEACGGSNEEARVHFADRYPVEFANFERVKVRRTSFVLPL